LVLINKFIQNARYNYQSCCIDIYALKSHLSFLYFSVRKGTSSGNLAKATGNKNQLVTFEHRWRGYRNCRSIR